jgi:signal recognition particle GTPase
MKVDEGQKPGEQFVSLLAAELVETMGKAQVPLTRRSDGRPNVILMAGLQGAGKTTAVAKLANWAKKQNYSQKLLLVAADIYRPAAIEQLQTLGARLGVDVYTEGQDVSPVQICRRALSKAIAEGYDTVIVDTAGRQVRKSPLSYYFFFFFKLCSIILYYSVAVYCQQFRTRTTLIIRNQPLICLTSTVLFVIIGCVTV